MTTTTPWTVGDACALHGRAVAWMLGVTLPIAALAAIVVGAVVAPDTWTLSGGPWWSALWGALGWAVVVDAVSALFVVAAAFVALPITFGVGKLVERVESTSLQVVVTSTVAGTLAAVPVVFGGAEGTVVTVPISVAAGAAGALARRGQLRRRSDART